MLNDTQRLHLQEMIKANNTEDTTNAIREVRHSSIIHSEVQELVNLKQKYSRLSKTNPQQFDDMCVKRCNFLFNNYTEIFNKVKKNEIDLQMLNKFLNVLKQIEDGKIDQHEGSYMVGTILKEIYIDSALKKAEKTDKKDKKNKKDDKPIKPVKISWKEYKEKIIWNRNK